MVLTFFVYKVSTATFPGATGIVMIVLTLIPLFGLISLLCIDGVAINFLKKSGIKVGFMGVSKSEINRIRSLI